MRVFLFSLAFVFIAFAQENSDQLKRLLAIIQGSFKDKVYTITIQKAKEYLKKAPEDDPYREKVLKILVYSYVKSKKFPPKSVLQLVESPDISSQTKEYIYSMLLKNAKTDEQKEKLLLKLYSITKNKKYLIKLADTLYKKKKYRKIIKLPSIKEINLYKVVALYKLKKYKDVVKFTDQMAKFPAESKDEVLYYRGLALIKLGQTEKGIKTLEAITFKTPKIIKYLANYYIKTKNYIYAERYLKLLTLEKEHKDFALFYLGYINEKQKMYDEAIKLYKMLVDSSKDSKYKDLAMQRIIYLKAKGKIPKGKFYTIRVVLYKTEEKANKFIKKHKLAQCFIYPYKKFVGVFCGAYDSKEEALKDKKKLQKKLKIKDMVIQKLEF